MILREWLVRNQSFKPQYKEKTMGNIPIGAEAAKLAGLHMDCNDKLRNGQLGLPEYEAFLNMTPEQRRQALASYMSDPRFKLANAFDLTVPDGYVHDTRLTTFKTAHGGEFSYLNPGITDENFKQATVKLAPGRKFKIKVFHITETVTSDDCLIFLRSQKAVLVGAQGASLVYELAKSKLPVNRWSISFDEKDALWYSGGSRRVPGVDRRSDDDFKFDLGYFEDDWGSGSCLLCFCDCSA